MKKLAIALALVGALALSGCASYAWEEPKFATPTPSPEPEHGTVVVEDVQGGTLLCFTYGTRIIKCDWLEN